MTLDPIFIHASPRSGSTYFFNVLRRNPKLMCFNEAISDVYHMRSKPKWDMHHDFLEQDDLAELKYAWSLDAIPPPYPAFRNYHEITPELESYLSRLILLAWSENKRPVFCEIYSRHRAKALKRKFGGFHIAQIRDFEPQFGSFMRALIEGGEWGFVTLPYLENNYSCIDAINVTSLKSIVALRADHKLMWSEGNEAAILASDGVLDIDIHKDRQLIVDRLAWRGIDISFDDYKKYPHYPIPSESEWREIVRKHRPNFKIAVLKLPLARHLYGKLSQWHRPPVHSQPMPDKLRQFLLSMSGNSPSP